MALRKASLTLMNRAVADLKAVRVASTSRALNRSYASAQEGTKNMNGRYQSPFQEIFDTIQGGKTFMGTSELKMPEIKYLKCGIPEHVLRFKTTTYGRLLEEPFVRPMEHRVTLQVDTRHIPLNEMEQLVLKEIVGTRLNDQTGILQLSSAQFGSRIENKRHLVSMLERIIESTKTLTARVESEGGSKTIGH